MKTLNAKRIAAVVAGAALLGVGLAFAGPITFQNVPIISNSGQPVVQIVVGSNAKPSDGVAAANIAAAIGNLAYTSVPVTASVNATQANNVLHVAVSSSSYKLSNQQVWLNESGAVGASAGSYVFSALIGSVLNGAIVLNSLSNTKTLQTGNQYSYQQSKTIALSPPASPYTAVGSVPYTSVTASTNGGGVSFSSGFTSGGYDNLMQVTSNQYSGLVSNYGSSSETESLWLAGFPVFDQGTTGSLVNQFQLASATGAYQATFGAPIQNTITNHATQINVPIELLGQQWTIINATGPSGQVSSTNTLAGGKLYLASSLVPLTTLYVGHNITSGPWTVQLTDLGQPNSNGVSPASLSVYYNNVLTNTSSVTPPATTKFNVTGHTMYVNVNQTFAGLYAYQKWAKLQMYTSVYELQNAHVFNQTTNPGWYVDLLWTNTTSTSNANAVALQSIIIYNTTPTTLSTGQSFNFIQSPHLAKLTFLGDTLGSSNFDSMSITSTWTPTMQYQNLGSVASTLSITNITEPAQELQVTSQIPNAFSYSGQTGSSVTYDLTPYQLAETGNTLQPIASSYTAAAGNYISNTVVDVNYLGNGATSGNAIGATWITSTYPLTVSVTGFSSNAVGTTAQTQSFTISTNNIAYVLPTNMYNVTAIQINRALPGTLTITVNAPWATNTAANTVTLATLTSVGQPDILYPLSGKVYDSLSSGNVIYNQQNGQPTNTFTLSQVGTNAAASLGINQYYTFTVGEQAVPTNSAAVDGFQIGIDNSSAGVGASPLFQLNYSVSGSVAPGTKNNATYQTNTQSSRSFSVQTGFRTEKGSKLVSITPSTVTLGMAKGQDELQFSITAANSTSPTKSYKMYGPYGVGQATNIANVSIGAVNATIAVNNAKYTISGISNLTATPSVANAYQPVLLKNLTTSPLVVLDSDASAGSNLILVGSGYVNTLSQQLQSSYNVSMTPTTQVTQAYGSNRVLVAGYTAAQTTSAANSFIQQLYAQAK